MLMIRLFGVPEVFLQDQLLKISRRKSRAMLYYLAAQSTPVLRDQMISMFWTDLPRPAAQQSLRTTLHGLRQILGGALDTEGNTLSIGSEVSVDVRIFEQALTALPLDNARLQEGLDFYRGDFLADFSLEGAQLFENWMNLERERLRRMAIRGLMGLSQAFERNGDFRAALDWLERALAFNRLQEDLQRESMRLLYLAGDRPGAIQRYEDLRHLLDEEMGVPPMAETRSLYDAIITDKLIRPTAGVTEKGRTLKASLVKPIEREASPGLDEEKRLLPFTGRETELSQIETGLISRKLVLIEGEPGVGKTRLAEYYLLKHKAQAIVGRARELEKSLPYQPIIEALRHLLRQPIWESMRAAILQDLPMVWAREVTRLIPELLASQDLDEIGGRAADESRLWEGVHQFLSAVAKQFPLVLFIDDLHSADASTLALLGYLIRQVQEAPIQFQATTRPVIARSPLTVLIQTLTRDNRVKRIRLERFSKDEVLGVARVLSPTYAYPFAEWLQARSEGNPFILSELVRHARQEKILLKDGTLVLNELSADSVVPQTVYSLIASRLGTLSDAARRVLDAGVAAGREFAFDVVVKAAGLSETAALDALDELIAEGLIRASNSSHFTFDHSLTMDVAYQEVGELRHRLLHRRVAEAIEGLYRDRLEPVAGQLAWHFVEGGAPERAASYALIAARQANSLAAWTEAAKFYELALEGSNEQQRLEIFIALGEMHLRAGHFLPATDVFQKALDGLKKGSAPETFEAVQLSLGRSLLPQARFPEMIEIARKLLSSERAETVMQAEVLWGTALAHEGADLDGAGKHLRIAGELALEIHLTDTISLAQIDFELGGVAAQQGKLEEAIRFYQIALESAEQSKGDLALELKILALNNLGYHLMLLDDRSAIDYAQMGLQTANENGVVGLKAYLYSTLGEISLADGKTDAAEEYFQLGLAIAERLAMSERVVGLVANLGLVALRRGQQVLAIHRFSSALGQADALGIRHLAAQIRLWLAPLLPDHEASQTLAEARAIVETSGRTRLLQELERIEQELLKD